MRIVATLLLVAHQPARLLPTIRSRCRELRLERLRPEDVIAALDQAGIDPGGQAPGLAELSGGSAGEAVRLYNLDGLKIYAEIVGLAASLPMLDRPRAMKLAEAAAQRGAEQKLDLLLALMDMFLARVARAGATGAVPPEAVPGEAEVIGRLAGSPVQARAWADCAQEVGARARHGRAVNLDPAALVMDMLLTLAQGPGAPDARDCSAGNDPMTEAPSDSMRPLLVDSHCHLDFPDFDGQQAELVARARAALRAAGLRRARRPPGPPR